MLDRFQIEKVFFSLCFVALVKSCKYIVASLWCCEACMFVNNLSQLSGFKNWYISTISNTNTFSSCTQTFHPYSFFVILFKFQISSALQPICSYGFHKFFLINEICPNVPFIFSHTFGHTKSGKLSTCLFLTTIRITTFITYQFI